MLARFEGCRAICVPWAPSSPGDPETGAMRGLAGAWAGFCQRCPAGLCRARVPALSAVQGAAPDRIIAMSPVDETREESQRIPELTAAAVPGLVVLWTRDRPGSLVLPLAQGSLALGRAAQEELFSDDDRVSREHCRVSFDGTGWTVWDLESRNGTYLDGARVASKAASLELPVLRVGRTLLWGVTDVRPFRSGVTVQDGGLVLGGLLKKVWAEIDLLGRAGTTLCLRGESGSGKELAARAFHALHAGARGGSPFVGVNCAAIPEGLAERLLFGARRGAFSGATSDVQGYIQAADGGTLFLDEVAELEPRVQAKLLRVLETREVLPLGATRPESVELRVCVAAHADLTEMVANGRFREDLYYRVGRPAVVIPPLRARLDELAWLIHGEVCRAGAQLTASVRLVEACTLRAWPGNVRELIGELRRAAHRALSAGRSCVDQEDLAEDAGRRITVTPEPASEPPRAPGKPPQAAPSDPQIAQALRDHGGNVTRAARSLGLHRNQLRRWLAKHPGTTSLPHDLPDEDSSALGTPPDEA